MKPIVFLGKDDEYGKKALEFCKRNLNVVDSRLGKWGDPFPTELGFHKDFFLISYCSRWIIPKYVLNRAVMAINFHPAPPEYRGIGGINFALYDDVGSFGVTSHHIIPEVDAGNIIEVDRFLIYPKDTVESLLERTNEHLLIMFYRILGRGFPGVFCNIRKPSHHWSGDIYTRKDLNKLAKITPDMSAEEIKKRVRAVTYKDWVPTMTVGKVDYAYVAQTLFKASDPMRTFND